MPSAATTWEHIEDAITWAAAMLPDKNMADLRKLFDELPAINGKKAPAWVEKVLEMALAF